MPIVFTVSVMSSQKFLISMCTPVSVFLNILTFRSFHRIQTNASGTRFQTLLTRGLEDMEDLYWLSEIWMEFLSLSNCLKTIAMSSHREQAVGQVFSR